MKVVPRQTTYLFMTRILIFILYKEVLVDHDTNTNEITWGLKTESLYLD